jgi:hypothetical protein
MKNLYKRIDNEEALLEDNENFISLDELEEKCTPLVDNEVNNKIKGEHLEYLVDYLIDNIPVREKDTMKIVMKEFYGINCDKKSLKEIAEDHPFLIPDSKNLYWRICHIKKRGDQLFRNLKKYFLTDKS